jgi:protein-arginine kinase activator protein McsA
MVDKDTFNELLICNNCGRAHFGVTRSHALSQVRKFNKYFRSLKKKEQQAYYGGKASSMADYSHCMQCGNTYKDFRRWQEGDPDLTGCTISAILAPV